MASMRTEASPWNVWAYTSHGVPRFRLRISLSSAMYRALPPLVMAGRGVRGEAGKEKGLMRDHDAEAQCKCLILKIHAK